MSAYWVLFALLWILIAIAIGIHASNRDRSGFIWFLVTFFLGLFGVVIYLLVISGGDDDEPEDVRVCSNCSTGHAGSPNFCSNCGEPLDPDAETGVARIVRSGSRAYCSNCNGRVAVDDNVCPDCGSVFSLESAMESNVADIIRSGSQAYCSNCQSSVSFDAERCTNCGSVF